MLTPLSRNFVCVPFITMLRNQLGAHVSANDLGQIKKTANDKPIIKFSQ